MQRALRKIETTYNKVAQEYATAFSSEHERKPKDQEILQRFAAQVRDRGPVWDLGCGPGQTVRYLSDQGIDISGLDLSEKMLEEARKHHSHLDFRNGNILDLEFEDGSIAGVVAFYAIVHFTEDQVGVAFREIHRVLQPGGVFLLTFHIGEGSIHLDEFLEKEVDIYVMFFSSNFVVNCLDRTGFGEIELIERDPYPSVEYQSQRAYVFAMKP